MEVHLERSWSTGSLTELPICFASSDRKARIAQLHLSIERGETKELKSLSFRAIFFRNGLLGEVINLSRSFEVIVCDCMLAELECNDGWNIGTSRRKEKDQK